RIDVGEVDRLAEVGKREPGRLGVAVDRNDPHAELLHPPDRAALVPAGADEEDGLTPHRRATLLARAAAGGVTVADVAHDQTQLPSHSLRVQLREEPRACPRAAPPVARALRFL